jgi:hypothetical protein
MRHLTWVSTTSTLTRSLREASHTSQVVVTSHSPDLLDDKAVDEHMIRAVTYESGETLIGPLDEAGGSAIRGRLYTAGELLRLDQIDMDCAAIDGVDPGQLELFADVQ